jgi:cytoskeletal protein CcmA (bactofilin family)
LIIEEGAQFQGQCIILGNETANDDSQFGEEGFSSGLEDSPEHNE